MERTKLGFIVGIVALGGLVGIFTPMYFISNSDYDSLSGDYLELSADFESLWGDHQNLVENYSMLLSNYLLLSENYDVLLEDYQNLNTTYNALLEDYQNLNTSYNALLEDYQNLNTNYNALLDDHQLLQFKYDTLNEYISQQILPVQYSLFAEAVRRYYMPIYLEGLSGKEYWMAFVEFCRDIILHDSGQYNAFSDVSNAFSDALISGNDTMNLAYEIMAYIFWSQINPIHWLPNWDGYDLTGNEITDISTIVDWCINEIDYEYDLDITLIQEDFNWDYIKFPVETAFRTFGDCEDQAILCAAYLESCGFETAIMIFHDPSHPTEGAFYHGVPLVHIEDTGAFNSMFPSYGLWRFTNDPYYPEYTWCFLDPTWDVPFGSKPSWLADYGDSISFSYCSIAFNDIDGAVGENIGLECFLPT